MELHAIGLSPELANWEDGARAAFVVALPLALLLVTGRSELGWAIFAAFWTCLADSGGPLKRRIGLSALFALPGAVVAFLASWFAGLGMVCAIVAGPLLVFLCGLLPYYRPAAGLVATLLAVVAVVAGGIRTMRSTRQRLAACSSAEASGRWW
ncbi:hypothetical protein [Novosphingobium sp. 9]|uniref:hypothetical protein n=1 Tax=Novosphingobium sp. 9 TaxID=2025349 RepID=UPI0021B693D5|nr:hypothetical protein [Novosphingobium sp. 9]